MAQRITTTNRNKSLYLLWGLICLIYLVQVVYYYSTFKDEYPFALTVSLFLRVLIVGLLLLRFLVIPVYDAGISMKRGMRLLVIFLAGIAYCLLYILLIFVVPALEQGKSMDEYLEMVALYLSSDLHNTFKNYLFLAAALFAFELLEKQRTWMVKNQKMELELSDTKLKMLKARLQPHFLFNALNGVVSVIDENSRKAQEMLIELSDILRTTLNADFKSTHSLEDEVRYLKKYLQLEKARYEEQLDFTFEIDQAAEQLQIPILLLQPIVENAIKHGYKGNVTVLKIVISAEAEHRKVTVKNNGTTLPSQIEFGEGMNQVQERLRIIESNNHVNYFNENGWVVFQITLPQ